MNAIVRKAFSKLSELPTPLRESVAQNIVANVEKWQTLHRDVTAGFASGPPTPWYPEEIKAEARRRMAKSAKRNARR